MIYYGIDIRPLAQLYPELWDEFLQLDVFFQTKPSGMIGLNVTELYITPEEEKYEVDDLEDILKELSKMMSVGLGVAIDQLPRKYYEIEA